MPRGKRQKSEEVYSPKLRRYVTVEPTPMAMRAQGLVNKRLGPFYVGMTADHALQCIKRSGRDINPSQIEHEGTILKSVKWFLTDCTLVLKRLRNPGPFIVVDIGGKEEVANET
jgi:hypothetical protein